MHYIKVNYSTRLWFDSVQEIGLRAKYVWDERCIWQNLIRIWDVCVVIIQCMSDNINKFFCRWHSEAISRTTLLLNRKERIEKKMQVSSSSSISITSKECHYHVPRLMVIRWKVSIYLGIEHKSSKVADHIDDTTIFYQQKHTFLIVAQYICTTRILRERQENTKKQYFFLHI